MHTIQTVITTAFCIILVAKVMNVNFVDNCKYPDKNIGCNYNTSHKSPDGSWTVTLSYYSNKNIRKIRQYDPSNLEWWKTSVIYQIYPRSFMDSGDDGIGDLKGITQKLDYFTYLGVGAIWISPFYKSPMRDFGYDVQNYTEVDKHFGTMTDFDELMKEAKKRDIKVILDFVPNHTSNDSEWFVKSRGLNDDMKYKDYYVWAEGKDVPNNWISVFGGSAWTWDDVRKQYYYHAFLDSQPDLNFRNPQVLQELKSVLKFWLDKGVAGFRVDAFKFAYEAKNQSFNEETPRLDKNNKTVYRDDDPHKYTTNLPELYDVIKDWRKLFEEYKEKDKISRFMSTESYGLSNEMRNEYYKAGSIPFNFDLITKLDKKCDGTCFKKIIEGALKDLPSDAWPNFVLGNHDQPRVANRMGKEMIDVMNMLLLTLPGTPTCYYGDEIGMKNVFYSFKETQDPYGLNYGEEEYLKYSRDPERSPMQWDSSLPNAGFSKGKPWLRVNENHHEHNVETERTAKTKTNLHVFKTVLGIRKQPSFQNKDITFSVVNENFLSFVRTAEGRPKYLVVLNVSPTDNSAITGDFSQEPVGSSKGEVVASTGTLDVAYGAIVKLNEIKLKRGQGLIVKVL